MLNPFRTLEKIMTTVEQLNEKVDTLLSTIDAEHAQFLELVKVVLELKASTYLPLELSQKLDLAIEKVSAIVDPNAIADAPSTEAPTPEPSETPAPEPAPTPTDVAVAPEAGV